MLERNLFFNNSTSSSDEESTDSQVEEDDFSEVEDDAASEQEDDAPADHLDDPNISKEAYVQKSEKDNKVQPESMHTGIPPAIKRDTTASMVIAAIKHLNNRSGSSLYAIKKCILNNHPELDEKRLSGYIKTYLKKGVLRGELVQTKGTGAVGSFKLAEAKDKKKTAPNKKKAKEQVKKGEPKAKAEPKIKLKSTAKNVAVDNNNNDNNNKQKLKQKPKTITKLKADEATKAAAPKLPKLVKKSNQKKPIAEKTMENEADGGPPAMRKLYRKSINLVVNPMPKNNKRGPKKKGSEKSEPKASAKAVVKKKVTKSKKKQVPSE